MSSRWEDLGSRASGADYDARFARLAAAGADVHGEATLCARLAFPGARILDAGCGTGRVAIRLGELGHDCVGVDLDPGMLAVARGRAPHLRWVEADLADLDLGEEFDLVVAAGNVVPLVAAGTEERVVRRLAGHIRAGGLLVTGFGLDAAHLPLTSAPVSLDDFDRWTAAAGLELEWRGSTWAYEPDEPYAGGGYAVSVLRRR